MTTVPTACRHCGVEPRKNARFCDNCGAPITRPSGAEYKQVTVLFADVVRSMEIAGALGPEALRELMTELVDTCGAVVRRYGGDLNQFTGDGIMALFGIPNALEDHARRACLAALDIQAEAARMDSTVLDRAGMVLRLRIGLNSGLVIAGDVGSAPVAYTAMGGHVGMAQRMESVAGPGGVMLSESTARLVEGDFHLGPRELARIKGSDQPVPVHRLLSAVVEREMTRRRSRLVGRMSENRCIAGVLEDARDRVGGVVTVQGTPGVGKTRLVQESMSAATQRGFDVFFTYCESHAREISFNVISRLLRAVFAIGGVEPTAARSMVRADIDDADDQDLLLLYDMLGIGETDMPLPDVSPDARRRRLIDLMSKISLARSRPTVYVIEDVHWIDEVSESMLAEFGRAIIRAKATILITYRPEYRGALSRIDGATTIELAPLPDVDTQELVRELLGADPSVDGLVAVIVHRAAGIPFCAEEIIRDLAERGEIAGTSGNYTCDREVDDVQVPATLQAAIGARIDRLDATAKRTLNAAAVMGVRFRADLVERLVGSADWKPLVEGQLVDVLHGAGDGEYAFHHPLTQKVAYESQLKSARSELHRRAAVIIEQTDAAATGEGAAAIATQYESAGTWKEAYTWSMRAAEWFGARDIRASRGAWEQAARIAHKLPNGHADALAMRIETRALLCGTAFRVGGDPESTGFEELRSLTSQANDKRSLAVGMAGYLNTLTFNSRHQESAETASELATLLESIGDPTMTVGLLYGAAQAKWEAGQAIESRRLAQRIIDLADGDLEMGNLVLGSPLAWATSLRGVSSMVLGQPGWRTDIQRGIAMARSFDAATRIVTQLYRFSGAVAHGAALPDSSDMSMTEESVEVAKQSGDNAALAFSYMNRAMCLLHTPENHGSVGIEALQTARELIVRDRLTFTLRRLCDIELARERLEADDPDGALDLAKGVLDEQFTSGEMAYRGPATSVVVEALLRRGQRHDLETARGAIERLSMVPTDVGFVLHRLPVLRLRALLARQTGAEGEYRDHLARYRQMAATCGFDAHIAEAARMP
ncbi:ATP-binding protein [Mycolicibacterium chlorophenolicum]|uniref:Adenylate cyclase 2 n=1 Tax=Mycolicibacterium chlorophenolicum TaxID=37916 RepID=A0A0J6VGE7_9MYCO|nr:Adenylate cyclase 2 [Mycolicibacterium chlorophenolicum]